MALFSVLGHEIPKRFLTTIIEIRKLSHFYLFIGPPGVGKGTIAEEFALSINCKERNNLCKKRVKERVHPDIKIWEEKTLKISHIKEIQKDVSLSPLEGEKKIIIIKDTEHLTQEAANSLLKILEEPPENTLFILTSSYPYMLPKTILSRAQIVKFSLLSFDIVSKIWHDRLGRKEKLPVYDGSMQFVNTLNIRTNLFSLFSTILKDSDQKRVYEIFEYGMQKRTLFKDKRREIINIWFSFLRDFYLVENDGIINLYKSEEIRALKNYIRKINTFSFSLFQFLDFLERGIVFNISFNIWWEYLILSTYDTIFGGKSG